MNLLNLAAVLTLDKSQYEKGLDEAEKEAEKSSESGGKLGAVFSGVGKVLGGVGKAAAVGLGVAATATVGFVKKSVAEYSEYQQLWGGVQKLYGAAGLSIEEYAATVGKSVEEVEGEYANLQAAQDLVLKNAEEAYKTAGMSTNKYMETATSFSAALINSLGGDTVKAAEMTDVAMRAISDNFNTFGGDIDSIQRAFQGFAKQNYTMLDNLKLGYGGTKGEMERLIADANAYAESIGEAGDMSIESFSDIVRAIELVQEKQGIAGTTAREAANTISGSLGMLKGAWTNLVAGISNPDADVGKLIEDVITSAKAALSNLLPTIKQATTGIVQLVRDVAPLISKELPDLIKELLPMIIETATELFNGLVDALPTLIEGIIDELPSILNTIIDAVLELLPQIIQLGLTLITSLAQGIAESLPELIPTIIDVILEIVNILTDPNNLSTLVDAAIAIIMGLANGLIEALPVLIEKLPEIIQNIVDALVENVPKLIDAGIEMVIMIAEHLPEIIAGLIEALPKVIGAIIEGLSELGSKLKESLSGAWTKAKEAFSGVGDWFKEKFSKAKEKAVGAWDNVKSKFKGVWKKIKEAFKFKDAFKWGKDMIANFINGIKEKMGALGDAVKGVAGKVKDFLGFSEPDEGPLSNFHTYAPDMIDLFVKGIKDNQKKLDKAITNAFDFKPMIEGGMDIGLANPNSKYVDRNEGVTINVYAAKNQNVNELADIIGRKLNNEIRRNQEVWA